MKYLLALTLLVTIPAHATDFYIQPFNGDSQGNAPWCWAATAQMVLDHLGIEKEDCDIVSKVRGENCCGWFPSSSCWSGGDPVEALAAFGVKYRRNIVATSQQAGASPKAAQAVVDAVRKNQLPILRMMNAVPGEPNHVVVVQGARYVESLNTLELDIFDPANGEQLVPIKYLLNGFYNPNGGDRYWWAETFLP